MHSKVKGDFWLDDEVATLPPEQRLCLLWAMTNPAVDVLGMTRVSQRRFEFETGCPYEVLLRACEALPKFMSFHGPILWVHNYVRHQLGHGRSLLDNNCFRWVCRALDAVKDEALRRAFLALYTDIAAVWSDWRSGPPRKGGKREGLANPFQGEREREGEGVPPEGGTRGEPEIPSEEEWLSACAMEGLPAAFAREEWNKLGEAGFQVRNGCYLTRSTLRFAVARRRDWYWEKMAAAPKTTRPQDREALLAELEDLRAVKDPASLPRRREIKTLLGIT